MKPTPGRIVLYTLSETDAEQINRRRTDGPSIAKRIGEEKWPLGAQAHIGNAVRAGDVVPAIVVKAWGEDETAAINGQAFLDGNDTFWLMSRLQGTTPGTWAAPPRE